MSLFELYSFNGRIGRRRFVLTQIGVFLFSYFATFLLIVIGGAGFASMTGVRGVWEALVNVVGVLTAVQAVWISIAAAVRRCHDRGLSGWMLLFAMPPVIGQLWLFLSLVAGRGDAGSNLYGPPQAPADLSPVAVVA
ncbi:MAG: DUF805 domain-containing protein [Caulobacter sp.]|nr:DUF805 domain-containing protein [Caulobacter sp.]